MSRKSKLYVAAGLAAVAIVLALTLLGTFNGNGPPATVNWHGQVYNCQTVVNAPAFTASANGSLVNTYPLPVRQACAGS
jgi:hypothetical protein